MTEQKLEILVKEYIDGFLQPRDKSIKEKIYGLSPKYNKEFADVDLRVKKIKDLAIDLSEQGILNDKVNEIIQIARKYNPSYETGLSIGYLFPDENLFLDEKTSFENGLKKGQIYGLKLTTSNERKKIMRGMMGFALGSFYHAYNGPYSMSEDNLSLYENLEKILTYGMDVSLIYGLYPMIRYNLFCNDMNPSKELITSGQFALHRNPFYFGIMSGFGLLLSKLITANAFSENPNWLATGIAAVGLVYTLNGFVNYTKIDEKVLEKQFGEYHQILRICTPS